MFVVHEQEFVPHAGERFTRTPEQLIVFQEKVISNAQSEIAFLNGLKEKGINIALEGVGGGGTYLVSKDVNSKVDNAEITTTAPFDDSLVRVRPYITMDGHQICSQPYEFLVAMKAIYENDGNAPFFEVEGWREKMTEAGLPQAIIEKTEAYLRDKKVRPASEKKEKWQLVMEEAGISSEIVEEARKDLSGARH